MEPLTTMEPFATIPELAELMMRTYADEKTFSPAAIYCVGQTQNNTISVVLKALELHQTGRTRMVAIPSYGGLPKYAWYHDFIRSMLLKSYRIPEKCIISIPHPQEFSIAHTHTEAIGLVRYAKKAGWKKLFITALPSHQLRAFLETITAVVREYPELKVYSVVGSVLHWTEPSEHSQSVGGSPRRFEVIATADKSEMWKILTYYLQGDLISAREALDYLNRRAEL